MKPRLLLRLFIGAIALNLIIFMYFILRKIKTEVVRTKDWLNTVQAVNQIHATLEDARRNRSGVPDDRTRVIVMAKLRHEDTSWVEKELPQWQRAIYTVDDPEAPLHTERNKGHEANAYLTYLIENYHSLPDFILFLHSHRDGFPLAWHNDNEAYDNVLSAHALRLDFVERNGYANLRCLYSPGCPDGLVPYRDPPNPDQTHEHVFPSAWRAMMGEDALIPSTIGVPCCSQFAVSKEQVLKRPKQDYERYYKWLMETELEDALSGRVMEYMWHIIFGQDPV
jgi:Protein of unknown function (DUF3431)